MTIKECKKGLEDIKQVINKDCVKLNDPNYAIYKIGNEKRVTPANKAAEDYICSNKPIFNREAQLKILEEEGYDPHDS